MISEGFKQTKGGLSDGSTSPLTAPKPNFGGQIPLFNTNTQMAAKRFEIETRT